MGDEIRRHRERLKLTQKQLGAAVGVTRIAVGAWERGESEPDEDNLQRLADVFHVTRSSLRYPAAEMTVREPGPPLQYGRESDRRRLAPAVYERIYRYLGMMAAAGLPEEKIQEAHRLMSVYSQSKLHAGQPDEPDSVDDQLADIEAAWNAIRESIERRHGKKL